MTTRERILSAAWWPTSTTQGQKAFVGAETCAKCHGDLVRSQSKSQMAHTLGFAADSSILQEHMKQQYSVGPYTYSLGRTQDHVAVNVSNGTESRSAVLRWAFGSGQVGQSYLWQEPDGSFREARLTYFSSMDTFGATPGRLHGAPTSIDMAMGRRVEGFEVKTCFGCHTTPLSSAAALETKNVAPGVTCEACHGPGAEHVAAMQSGSAAGLSATDSGGGLHIVNAGRMTPVQSVDFCGACHSTPWDVRMMGATGIQTVRFPAYRLEKSRCWGVSGDARVTCKACHDPHEPLQREPAAYDTACLGCHLNGKTTARNAQQPGKACPVATTKCVTCHMQKYQIPEMHSKFTDHMIRVGRNGAAFPD